MKILAILAEASTACAALNAALAAGQSLPNGVNIEALHVVVDPRAITVSEEEVAVQQLREADEGPVRERAEAMRTRFVSWMAGVPDDAPRIGWREVAGDEESSVTAAASGADLLVLARPDDLDGHDALHAVLFDAGKPILFVPPDWIAHAFPGPVIIAWDGSAAVCRAVDGAMPWLALADDITIVSVGDAADDAAGLVGRLQAEGISARSVIVPEGPGGVTDTILSEAHTCFAGLLVAGAYRRNRVVEWLFGGVTRDLLDHANLPVLLAH